MLKTVKMTFKLTNESKKNIIRTFNKVSQKFGHIVLCGELLGYRLVMELIDITKRYNNKLTVKVDGPSFIELSKNDVLSFRLILEHIDILGLIINTTDFDPRPYQTIITHAYHYNCVVNLYTPLTPDNYNLNFTKFVNELTYHQWFIETTNEDYFNTFRQLNPIETLIHMNDYYFVLPNGQIVNQDHKTISSINKPSVEIYRDLIKTNPNLKNQIQNVHFNYTLDKYYLEKITKKIKSGKAMFFDIEAVSRESTNSQKHQLKDYPIPILFSLIKIDAKSLRVSDRSSFSVTNVSDLHTIYQAFLTYVKEQQIEYLVVSNGDLEKRFIENCIIYLKNKLKVDDFRYLFKLKDNLIDIQKVIDQQMNSYKLLQELATNYPDLITFVRKTSKLSFKINFLLDGLIFGPKHHEEGIQKIIEYCFEDVYADFELFKFYDFIYNHHLV